MTATLSLMQVFAAVAAAAVATSTPADQSVEPLLFLDLNDTHSARGLVWAEAKTVAAANPSELAPPPLNYTAGCLVIATLPSATVPGEWEVYGVNTSGSEPVAMTRVGHPEGSATLVRFTTRDFLRYSPPAAVLTLPTDAGTPTLKSIARSPEGRYVMFASWEKRYITFVSTDAGMSWALANTTGVSSPDKDDLNIIYSNGRFVDMQIVWQNWSLRYCDNGGCDRRRTIAAKTSADGVAWGPDSALMTPDDADPPELQFYRMRPFYIGNTSRLAAHVLQYAPAPSVDILGWAYGRHPPKCDGANGSLCHGPHMYEEWFVGPSSGDAAVIGGWRRPFRRTHAAPHDAFLMAQPAAFGDDLVWVGSTGSIYTLPMFRISGIFAPANGEFSTAVFTVPEAPVWVNADVHWDGPRATGGCDEGCAAYLLAAVLDAETGQELPGYGVKDTRPLMGVDGQRLPLVWKDANGANDSAARGEDRPCSNLLPRRSCVRDRSVKSRLLNGRKCLQLSKTASC